MPDKLVAKCLLTKEEWLDIWYSGDDEKHLEFYNTYVLSTCLRQLTKAIPLIRKAVEAEKRIEVGSKAFEKGRKAVWEEIKDIELPKYQITSIYSGKTLQVGNAIYLKAQQDLLGAIRNKLAPTSGIEEGKE